MGEGEDDGKQKDTRDRVPLLALPVEAHRRHRADEGAGEKEARAMNWHQKVLMKEAYFKAKMELRGQRSSEQRRFDVLWWALRRGAISWKEFEDELGKMGIRW